MKFRRKYVVSVLVALLLLAGLVTPAYAADGIATVDPGTIVNNIDNTITVSLQGATYTFVSGAAVLLNGSAYATSVLTSGVLTASIPAGITPGTYTVSVRNPDNTTIPCGVAACSLVVTAPVATATAPFTRPQIVVTSSDLNVNVVRAGKTFKWMVDFKNEGTANAYNLQVVFTSGDAYATETGGVSAVGNIPVGALAEAEQTFIANDSLYGKLVLAVDMTVTYYDEKGTAYTDKFTLSAPVDSVSSGYAATVTPTGVKSGQLVIPSYGTTVDPLQPGVQFTLTMTVQNVGNDTASHVTMIVGGGSSGNTSGTPEPGGVSGGNGEFTNFAPVGTSNVQSLGDLVAGGMVQVSQNLIVNVSTNPGAYPMKITFSYMNRKGEVVNDEQVITLLVYSLPFIEVNFYRVPDPFFVGQPGQLPIQLVNLGKRSAVLGNMTVTTQNGTLENATTLVGAVDAGGYFTLDSMLTPDSSGKVTLNVVIEYTDDFNQARKIEKTLEVTVEEGMMEPTLDPSMQGSGGGGGGGGMEVGVTAPEETAMQKVWRFVLGLLGLDSAPPAVSPEMPSPGQQMPIPAPSGGGKGG